MSKQVFNKKLYRFFKKNKRDFPWRDTTNPYHILVSEVMLQQTQAPRVIEKYTSFIKLFPTIHSLASAQQKEVLQAWQGLGYNRRAVFLHKTAQIIQKEHNSSISSDPEVLKTLPGIGENTAGSICAFAFNIPVIFIETNIRSVFIHTFFKKKRRVEDREITPLIENLIDKKNPRKWYSALMDYGVNIKKEKENPSRKSKQYTKQSPLKGSVREVRGYIISLALKERRVHIKDIEKIFQKKKTQEAIKGLFEEGIIEIKESFIALK